MTEEMTTEVETQKLVKDLVSRLETSNPGPSP